MWDNSIFFAGHFRQATTNKVTKIRMLNYEKEYFMLKFLQRNLDAVSIITILITLILFIAALYFTGLTHDILLEAGVFLVSVKLIIMSFQNKQSSDTTLKEIKEIHKILQKISDKKDLS